MFQNLRANSQIYILHKDSTPYLEQGSIVSVSNPRPTYPAPQQLGQFPQMELVVDLVVNIGGQNTNFQGLPAGVEIADFGQNGNIVVSCSRDAISSEILTARQRSLDIVNSRDYHLGLIESYDKIYNNLNPEFAAKQQQDREIAAMKEQIAAMTQNVNNLMIVNQKLMEQLGINSETPKNNKKQ